MGIANLMCDKNKGIQRGGRMEDTCDHRFSRTSLRAKLLPVELGKKSDEEHNNRRHELLLNSFVFRRQVLVRIESSSRLPHPCRWIIVYCLGPRLRYCSIIPYHTLSYPIIPSLAVPGWATRTRVSLPH